jgi:sigma-B regulation protein RsbU (phosphoserine phosphatase)
VVAGDFYDVFPVPSIHRVALVIGDVCDKGVGAALFMTLFRSLIRATMQSRTFVTWAVDQDPANALAPGDADFAALAKETLTNTVALTNNYVATTHGKTSMFASALIGLLDPESGNFSYVNAGHEQAFITGPKGIRETLPPTGPVLGIFAGVEPKVVTARLDVGETLIAYSDGVPEAVDRAGEQFSEERLRKILDSCSRGAAELLDTISASVNTYTQGAAQHDDITMLAVHRTGTIEEVS